MGVILVCGDRHWLDYLMVLDRITEEAKVDPDLTIIHGAANGADSFAGMAALQLGVPVEAFHAAWRKLGKRAGVIRNFQMRDRKPDKVLAFHDDIQNSKGTKHMVSIANEAGIPVEILTHAD